MSRSHFCTMGGVSDWVNIGHTGRLGAWFAAVAVALLGAALLQAFGIVDLNATRPPYRQPEFFWLRHLLGGLLFGVGMTLAGGCVSKNLIRLGGGSGKALVALLAAGASAYAMTQTTLFNPLFAALQTVAVDLGRFGAQTQDLGTLLAAAGGVDPDPLRLACTLLAAALIGTMLLRSPDFREHPRFPLSGVAVGLAVVAAWYLTGGPWGQEWQAEAEWLDQPPVGVATQALTFVNPLGETLAYLGNPTRPDLITFGMLTVAGVALGSLIDHLAAGRLRLEWFGSAADAARHLGGGLLMGFGGVLALGCSIGQGVSGPSTLALGSLLTLGAIILASATTMKVMYYRLLYQDASLLDAWLSGWVDLRLLPSGCRRLDAL